jgi:hypothetical protein
VGAKVSAVSRPPEVVHRPTPPLHAPSSAGQRPRAGSTHRRVSMPLTPGQQQEASGAAGGSGGGGGTTGDSQGAAPTASSAGPGEGGGYELRASSGTESDVGPGEVPFPDLGGPRMVVGPGEGVDSGGGSGGSSGHPDDGTGRGEDGGSSDDSGASAGGSVATAGTGTASSAAISSGRRAHGRGGGEGEGEDGEVEVDGESGAAGAGTGAGGVVPLGPPRTTRSDSLRSLGMSPDEVDNLPLEKLCDRLVDCLHSNFLAKDLLEASLKDRVGGRVIGWWGCESVGPGGRGHGGLVRCVGPEAEKPRAPKQPQLGVCFPGGCQRPPRDCIPRCGPLSAIVSSQIAMLEDKVSAFTASPRTPATHSSVVNRIKFP